MTLFETLPASARRAGVPDPCETPWTLAVLGAPALAFVVHGQPAPQGSKKPVGMRRTQSGALVSILKESSAERVDKWRSDVKQAAERALPAGWVRLAEDAKDGVVVDLVLTRDRPVSLPKRRICWPGSAPDLSKLARSTEDALTAAGVWRDDARVIAYRRLDKVYVGSGDPDALPHPGAVIRVWSLPRGEK